MRDIIGYEGIYSVTSCGRVYSHKTNKFLKPGIDTSGYCIVTLYKDGTRKTFKVHRLVLEAYVPNTENLPQVNHKDENKTNNCIQNLEWCDAKYNNNYGTRNQRVAQKRSHAIVQMTMNGEIVTEYPSIMEAARQTGFSSGHISECVRGKRKSVNNFKWQRKVSA